MPTKMARSECSTVVRARAMETAVGTARRFLREGRKTANIHANSGFIWGIPACRPVQISGTGSYAPTSDIVDELARQKSATRSRTPLWTLSLPPFEKSRGLIGLRAKGRSDQFNSA
jgi:hypothetical protein